MATASGPSQVAFQVPTKFARSVVCIRAIVDEAAKKRNGVHRGLEHVCRRGDVNFGAAFLEMCPERTRFLGVSEDRKNCAAEHTSEVKWLVAPDVSGRFELLPTWFEGACQDAAILLSLLRAILAGILLMVPALG